MKKNDYGLVICLSLLIILIISGAISGLYAAYQIKYLKADVETYKNLLSQEQHEQKLIIIGLKDLVDEQHALNGIQTTRIEANHQYMNDIAARAYDNSIDIDMISYEGIMTHIDELWVYVEMINRKVK